MTAPMDLTNMRKLGVRVVSVWCSACGHEADVLVDHLPGDLEIPNLATRFRCSKCGSKAVIVRPAWHTRAGIPKG